MSNSNINNGKRHVRDRAYYGGAPNQKKRVRHSALENKKYMDTKWHFTEEE